MSVSLHRSSVISSLICLLTIDHSGLFPAKRLLHKAISEHVISTPKSLQILLNGRFPTVVRGAKNVFPLKSTDFFFISGSPNAPSLSTTESDLAFFTSQTNTSSSFLLTPILLESEQFSPSDTFWFLSLNIIDFAASVLGYSYYQSK
ncbi:hypothetical protein AX774_g4236 [Zancudomyces culisetae]|uniref:Uncharacterized protein n=1 Tax=Zancudomyces culisetae TaxID=1213189 RepID=A0A1R1PMV5_ZANCU|nr:hypothetical protein AX774_g4236 [Zancudomyces culisetae]|eukprot:OMH82288.1 hypothetical protein AX774_g4236 [Zancudomyces culisetae]